MNIKKNKFTMSVLKNFHLLSYMPYNIRDYCFCKYHGLNWDKAWRLWDLPFIDKARGSEIIIGKRFTACSNPKHNSIGVNQKVIIKTTSLSAIVLIGDDVGISGCTISARKKISIGNRVMLGAGCLLTDNDAHPLHASDRADPKKIKARSVIIDDDVFIGARAIILKGVHLEKGCVVGAGSVVTISAPENSILAGNPAKIVKKLVG